MWPANCRMSATGCMKQSMQSYKVTFASYHEVIVGIIKFVDHMFVVAVFISSLILFNPLAYYFL